MWQEISKYIYNGYNLFSIYWKRCQYRIRSIKLNFITSNCPFCPNNYEYLMVDNILSHLLDKIMQWTLRNHALIYIQSIFKTACRKHANRTRKLLPAFVSKSSKSKSKNIVNRMYVQTTLIYHRLKNTILFSRVGKIQATVS